jgi:hypothetical protein
MHKRNAAITEALAGILVLSIMFVSWRARTFHYCFGYGGRGAARVTSGAEPCAPDETPGDWRRAGWLGKIELVGTAAAKAFGGN